MLFEKDVLVSVVSALHLLEHSILVYHHYCCSASLSVF
jgi:hypothetical protein